MSKNRKPYKSNGTTIEASINGDVAQIRIVDYIGSDGSNESDVRNTIDGLLHQNITSAEVYINSAGGSVFVATEIVNQLKRIPSVTVIGGALIASAGTYITSHFYTKISSNTQVMIHQPIISVSGNIADIKSNLKLLENITSDYRASYAMKTKKSENEIEKLWSIGDYWMTAQEAKNLGFVDELINESVEITKEDELLLEAYSAPNKHQNVYGVRNHYTTPVVQNRANNDVRSHWTLEDYLTNDPEALSVLEATNPASFKALNDAYFGTTTKQTLPNNTNANRNNWTLEDYLTNDPEALRVMEATNPASFKALNDAYFGVK